MDTKLNEIEQVTVQCMQADLEIKRAEMRLKEAYTLETLHRAGFLRKSAVKALKSGDWADLISDETKR